MYSKAGTVDSVDFTLDKTRYTLTRDMVIKGMRRQTPGRIQTWAVDIEGVTFPVKQVLAQALGIPSGSFISTRAQDLLSKLGFEVMNTEDDGNVMSEHAVSRLDALRLAVDFLNIRPETTVTEVIEAAASFHRWMSGPTTDLLQDRG